MIYSDNGTKMAGEKNLERRILNMNFKRVIRELIDRGIDSRKSLASEPILVLYGKG